MTIDKAIKALAVVGKDFKEEGLEALAVVGKDFKEEGLETSDAYRACQLGIEALKQLKQVRESGRWHFGHLLPGETEEKK